MHTGSGPGMNLPEARAPGVGNIGFLAPRSRIVSPATGRGRTRAGFAAFARRLDFLISLPVVSFRWYVHRSRLG